MGFKDMFNVKLQTDPSGGDMRPVFSAEEKHRLQKIAKDMEKDEQDPEYNAEEVGFNRDSD